VVVVVLAAVVAAATSRSTAFMVTCLWVSELVANYKLCAAVGTGGVVYVECPCGAACIYTVRAGPSPDGSCRLEEEK
jgi:hypothetical protein